MYADKPSSNNLIIYKSKNNGKNRFVYFEADTAINSKS